MEEGGWMQVGWELGVYSKFYLKVSLLSSEVRVGIIRRE